MTSPPSPKPKPDAEDRFGARDVVDFVLSRYRLGRSTDGLLYAVPSSPSAPRLAREIRGLRPELSRALWTERQITVGREAMGTALETLLGLADAEAPTRVHLRSARVGPALYLDLGDTSGRFVEISAHGWEIRDPAAEADPDAFRPVWRRTAGLRPLPAPVRGGSRDDLRDLLGLAEDDPRWRLTWGWLVGALFEDVPRPILWALGPQGSGKSTRARMALAVVDPVEALGREPGRNERDDTTAAAGRFLPSWDNIGAVSASTSDWLCRLVTGVENSRRALYTDDDLRTSTLRRSGVATSIVLPFGLGPDALERLVLVELDRVPEVDRRPESALWDAFAEAHPRILGALLDDVVAVLAHLDEARETARNLPRMADYALLLHALDASLDLDPWEGYAEAYARSVRDVLADRATADPLTAALLSVATRANGHEWSGTAEALLKVVEPFRPDDPRAGWPTSPRSLSAALTKAQEALRAAGLVVERGRDGKSRRIVLRVVPVDPDLVEDGDAEEVPAPPPAKVVPIRRPVDPEPEPVAEAVPAEEMPPTARLGAGPNLDEALA